MENKGITNKKDNKTKVTTIRIDEELCNQIDDIAKKSSRTRTKQIEFMIKSWIEFKKN